MESQENKPPGDTVVPDDVNFAQKPPILPKATGLLIIVLLAVLGYAITSFVILNNLIEHPEIPKTFLLGVNDTSKHQKRAVFTMSVSSKLSIDSLRSSKPKAFTAYSDGGLLFHENPAFLIWVMLICIMISIASGSAGFFFYKCRELITRFQLPPHKIFWSIVYAGFIIFLLWSGNMQTPGFLQPPDIIDSFHILLTHGCIITWIVGTVLALIFPGLVLLFLIGSSSDRIFIRAESGIKNPKMVNQESIEEATVKLKYLSNLLQNTLQILATIVVFAVLTSKSIGEAIEDTVAVQKYDLYPTQASYVYGMYFTLFLCIIYIPVYVYLKNNYNSIKELATHENGGTSSAWYLNLFGENKFEGTALNNLKLALTVIAPLLTSFLPAAGDFLK